LHDSAMPSTRVQRLDSHDDDHDELQHRWLIQE
jgi:hypothetical protein